MKTTRKFTSLSLIIALLLTLFTFGFYVPAFADGQSDNPLYDLQGKNFVPGQLLVGIVESTRISQDILAATNRSSDVCQLLGVDILCVQDLTCGANAPSFDEITRQKPFTGRQILLLELNSSKTDDLLEAIEILEKNPLVAYAEPNYIMNSYLDPNDYYFPNSLGGLLKIQAPEAWDKTTGSQSVKIGVIDSGVADYHEDLEDNLRRDLGRHFYNGSIYNNVLSDSSGHGTMVSGIIGAVGDNTIGVVGVCWEISLVPIRITNQSVGNPTTSEFIAAIEYADELDLPIINCSVGYYGSPLQSLEEAIEDYGGLLVAAAGNDGINLDTAINKSYPASFDCENIISVAASNGSDQLAVFSSTDSSNYGATIVDLASSGWLILSTTRTGGYLAGSGTSFAAPHVAGAAALLKAYGFELGLDLTTQQLKTAILDNVDDVIALHGLVSTGGRLNVSEAIKSIESLPPDLTETFTSPYPGYDPSSGEGYINFPINTPISLSSPGTNQWLSSNPSVATVAYSPSDPGNSTVTGIAPGASSIVNGAKDATVNSINIMVVQPNNISSYRIPNGKAGLHIPTNFSAVIDLKIKLGPNVNPPEVTYDPVNVSAHNDLITWHSDDISIAAISGAGVITAVDNGATVIRGEFVDPWGQEHTIDYLVVVGAGSYTPTLPDNLTKIFTIPCKGYFSLPINTPSPITSPGTTRWLSTYPSIMTVVYSPSDPGNATITGIALGASTLVNSAPYVAFSTLGIMVVQPNNISAYRIPDGTGGLHITMPSSPTSIDLKIKLGTANPPEVTYDPATVIAHRGLINWYSDNESIATVSGYGVVTAVGIGSTVIRGELADPWGMPQTIAYLVVVG